MRRQSLPGLALVLFAFAACGGGELGRAARTTVTSGDPRPGASPAPSRAIDNTGFVDPGGRTSDQHTARPQTSGARATEAGADRSTGTNTGIPVGADLGGRGRGPVETPRRAEIMPRSGGSPLAAYEDVPGRFARALCDHQTSCTRVGAGRTWQSQHACTTDYSARANAELASWGCQLDRASVASCLAAIRAAPCSSVVERLDSLPGCRSTELCAP